MSRYQMVMGRNSSKRNRTKDEPDIMRWVLNLVVPLMTLFGILNLVVSGEAVEGLYKFFKNKGGEENNPYYAAADSYRNDEKRNMQQQNMQPNYQMYQNYGMRQNFQLNQFQKQQMYMNQNLMPGNQLQQQQQQQVQTQQQQQQQQAPPQQAAQEQQEQQQQQAAVDIPNLPNRNLIGQARPSSPVNIQPEQPEPSLLDQAPAGQMYSLNKYKTGETHLGDKDDDLEENMAADDDFKPGLDFNDMKFDESQKAPECPNLDAHDFSEDIEPIYKLDPNKYLVPVLFFGPNNQIHGLREAIVLAIKLNRTLALPPFHKHKGAITENKPYADLVEATHRIDERALRHLLPIVRIEDLREKCGSWFGVAFLARQVTCSGNMFERLSSFEYFSKIHLLNHATLDNLREAMSKPDCKLLAIPELPPSASLQKGRGLMLPDSAADLQNKIYKSDEACAAFLFPFKNYVFDPLIVKSQADQLSDDMTELMKNVVNHTPRPDYIKHVATMFIDEVISNGDFIAIHWRYDKDDWLAANCKEGVSEFMQTKCSQIHETHEDGTVLARGIAKLVQFLEQKGATKSKIIYMATPVAEEATVKQVTEWLSKETNIQILSSLHLQTFFDHFYSECDVTKRDWLDLLSILEQEVVYRSTVFIRSVVSSWSLNVQLQRSIEQRDKHDVTNWRLLGV